MVYLPERLLEEAWLETGWCECSGKPCSGTSAWPNGADRVLRKLDHLHPRARDWKGHP